MKVLSFADLKSKGIRFTRQHLHRLVQAGRFPAPFKLGENSNAWIESEVEAWLEERVKQRGAAKTTEAA